MFHYVLKIHIMYAIVLNEYGDSYVSQSPHLHNSTKKCDVVDYFECGGTSVHRLYLVRVTVPLTHCLRLDPGRHVEWLAPVLVGPARQQVGD